MAVYKVIQDIEAEDKLLGPLTLKGFIYAAIAGVLAFINFRILITTGLGPLRWLFILLFSLPMMLFGVLASPLGRDQPTEVWLLSHVRFLVKPRKRIWNQSGIKQLVTITAPKKVERQLTKGLSQTEVRSRLQALAMTLDTRGWAVRNTSINTATAPYLQKTQVSSDRLIGASTLGQNAPVIDIHPADDILDEQNNPTAQKFDQLVKQSDVERKKNLLDKLRSAVDHEPEPEEKIRFVDPDTQRVIVSRQEQVTQDVKQGQTLEERLIKARKTWEAQHSPRVPKDKAPAKQPEQAQASTVTAVKQVDNMKLAQSGSDFKVSTIAQLANRPSMVRQISPNEVEISLR